MIPFGLITIQPGSLEYIPLGAGKLSLVIGPPQICFVKWTISAWTLDFASGNQHFQFKRPTCLCFAASTRTRMQACPSLGPKGNSVACPKNEATGNLPLGRSSGLLPGRSCRRFSGRVLLMAILFPPTPVPNIWHRYAQSMLAGRIKRAIAIIRWSKKSA